MALTTKGLDTRARIIDGASQVLRDGDFGEILLDDVLALTNTSKGQLFHYFPGGKDELLIDVMQHEADRVLADQQPYLGDLGSWRAWEQWREALIARYRAQGTHCPLNSLMGQAGNRPGADAVVRALLTRWQGALADGIRAMQAAGNVDDALDAHRVAGALVAGIQGGVTVMRSTGSTEHLEAVLEVVLAQLRPAGRLHR
jgi:AcrR family transcriptional regulator